MDVPKKNPPPKKRRIEKRPQQALLDAIGGEPLAGSGFEEEEPEPGFSEEKLAARPLIKSRVSVRAFSTRAAWVAGAAAVTAAGAACGVAGFTAASFSAPLPFSKASR